MSRKKRKVRQRVTGRDRVEKHESGGSIPYLNLPEGAQLFQPKTGRMSIDILEYEVGKGNPIAEEETLYYERTYFVHRGIGATNDTYVCPAKTSGNRCPVCEHRSKLQADGDEENEKLIYDLKPSERQLFNVINVKEPDKGVQIFDFSWWNFGKKLDAEIRNADEDDNWHDFASYENGLTLRVAFAEDKFQGNTFNVLESVNFKPRSTEYDEDEMLEEVYCLDDVVKELPYKKLKDIFLQTSDEDEEEEEEDDPEDDECVACEGSGKSSRGKTCRACDGSGVKSSDDDDEEEEEEDDDDPPPKAKKKASKKKPKKKDWDDFDDDEDEEEEEEEEDDPPPKAKKKKRARRPDPDEEEEEEEEEDDPPPKAKKKAAKKKSRKVDDDDDWDD